jgi:hypothetical protein
MECTAVKDFSSFELCEYLVKQGLLCKSDAEVLEKKSIDGELFCQLSREDLAILLPRDDQFILGVKLYKLIQSFRSPSASLDWNYTTGSVTATSSCSSDALSKTTVTHTSTPVHAKSSTIVLDSRSSHSSSEFGPRKRSKDQAGLDDFTLPEFSPDIQHAIKEDSFLTAAKRNKLIRETCRAYKGYCRHLGRQATAEDKRILSKRLYELAPKSLGDPPNIGVKGVPNVIFVLFILV